MFGGFFNRCPCPIGIDVGTHSVRMMQIEQQADRLTVVAAAHHDLKIEPKGESQAFDEQVTRAIRQMLDGGTFTGNVAVSCLAASQVHYKNLRLPKMPAEELSAAVKWEANDRLHLGEPTAIQYFDAGLVQQGDSQRQEIILLAATNRAVAQHTQVLVACGLKPIAIDAIPAAIARCLGEVAADQSDRVIIDIGYTSSKVLICRGCRVMFYKQVNLGGHAFDQAVVDHLNITLHEASEVRHHLHLHSEQVQRSVQEAVHLKLVELSREIGLCLRYYSVTFHGQRLSQAMLVGGEANQHDLARVIHEGAGIEVSVANPLAGFDLSRVDELASDEKDLARWSIAAGLAMRPMDKPAEMRGAA